MHTTVSGDGRSSLEDVVAAAKARGYRVLAITDHAEGTLSGVGREALLEQRPKIRALQRGARRLARRSSTASSSTSARTASSTTTSSSAQGFDLCLASVHDHFELDRAAQTRRIVTAMQDPTVRMIGHLSARMIGGRPPIELDLDAIFDAAEKTGTALEVNGGLPRLDMSVEALRRARARDVTFVLTSDAHHADELERVEYAALNAERAWIEPERVANTWTTARLLGWTEAKRAAARPA